VKDYLIFSFIFFLDYLLPVLSGKGSKLVMSPLKPGCSGFTRGSHKIYQLFRRSQWL